MEVKGTAVIAIRDYVKNEFASDYKKWLSTLSPKAQEIFNGAIDATDWYPIEYGANEPTIKIAATFFSNNIVKGSIAAGRYSADKALTGIYKIFVKAANPTYIVKRASRVFATYYRPCEITVIQEPKNGVVVEMSKFSTRYEAIENRVVGWCERALEISGCEDVNIKTTLIREESEGKVIEINMRWS